MKVIKQGKPVQPVPPPAPGPTAEELADILHPPMPQSWRGPHTCPNCGCKFELEDGEEDKIENPEVGMGWAPNYFAICPNDNCPGTILL